jgi:hypothetical protein
LRYHFHYVVGDTMESWTLPTLKDLHLERVKEKVELALIDWRGVGR